MNEITHLSFSRLKALSHSPLCLKRYIEQTRTSTKAMDEGTLLDCLLFEKDTFKDRFFIMPEGVKKPTIAQINAKKPSADTLEQIAVWEEIQSRIGKRIVITQDQYDDSEFIAECVKNNSTVVFQGLLHPDNFKFQVTTDFFYKGFKHKGIKDAEGLDRNGKHVIWDLKRMSATNGIKSIRYQIKDMMYAMQAAIYSYALKPQKYYLVVLSGINVYVVELNIEAIQSGEILWSYYATRAIKHRKEGFMNPQVWDIGVEFWSDNSDGTFNL